MLEVHEAQKVLLEAVAPLPRTTVPLEDARGRILAETVAADRDFPPTDRSAMDGFAVRAADCAGGGRTLRVAGEIRAGQDAARVTVGTGEAVRIFTGAMMPRGADAVVMIEHAEEDRAAETVIVKESPEAGQNIRRRGEDQRAGTPVLAAGTEVRAAEIAALAAVGRERVEVVRAATAAVLSTGDEIVGGGREPLPHQIRDSNAKMLLAQLRGIGVVSRDLGIAGDDAKALAAGIADGLASDVLVLSGGVSVGAYDLVEGALRSAGSEILFHSVSMRPGKPLLAARRGGCTIFGLPGNPVSAFTCLQLFVVTALRKLAGHSSPVIPPIRATLDAELRRRRGRLTYHLARLTWRGGAPHAAPVPSASSGDVLALARANAFIVAPGSDQVIPAGASVDVLPWMDR